MPPLRASAATVSDILGILVFEEERKECRKGNERRCDVGLCWSGAVEVVERSRRAKTRRCGRAVYFSPSGVRIGRDAGGTPRTR
jgi:hypothetical protein